MKVPENEKSGANWVQRFSGSSLTSDLDTAFRVAVDRFLFALQRAGARVSIAATYRPPERAYLMHWSWKIKNNKVSPDNVPPMDGVRIEWDHGDKDTSIRAAAEMVSAYGMDALHVAPAIRSRHTEGKAIDMTITWAAKELVVQDAFGNDVKIESMPRNGMNTKLHEVGATYGVVKFWKGAADKPHWSTDGR